MNEVVLVKASDFNREGQQADKNGMQNVFLKPIAGKIPNQAQVVAGTVAVGNGIVSGNLQLVLIDELEPHEEFGRQFSVTVLDADVAGDKVIGYRRDLGAAIVVKTSETDADENADENGTEQENKAKQQPTIKSKAGAKAGAKK